ncbi:uncharacterized protein KY384_000040 [Bacidia gigantensis]|uniref:uncharacterized protein n=1 Tax=Bacidia gigantensis TaxID=2732470 RepID=UPI001D046AD4|nr:uncharacterized protein KY384_000040 [Bacidia gigantensis]KAG8526447.1 hypothetical protein KY384_000040 [Bacidia gigantensis]
MPNLTHGVSNIGLHASNNPGNSLSSSNQVHAISGLSSQVNQMTVLLGKIKDMVDPKMGIKLDELHNFVSATQHKAIEHDEKFDQLHAKMNALDAKLSFLDRSWKKRLDTIDVKLNSLNTQVSKLETDAAETKYGILAMQAIVQNGTIRDMDCFIKQIPIQQFGTVNGQKTSRWYIPRNFPNNMWAAYRLYREAQGVFEGRRWEGASPGKTMLNLIEEDQARQKALQTITELVNLYNVPSQTIHDSDSESTVMEMNDRTLKVFMKRLMTAWGVNWLRALRSEGLQ